MKRLLLSLLFGLIVISSFGQIYKVVQVDTIKSRLANKKIFIKDSLVINGAYLYAPNLPKTALGDTGLVFDNGRIYKGKLSSSGGGSFDSTHYWTNLFINKISPKTTFQLIIPSASKTIWSSGDSLSSISPDGTIKSAPTTTDANYVQKTGSNTLSGTYTYATLANGSTQIAKLDGTGVLGAASTSLLSDAYKTRQLIVGVNIKTTIDSTYIDIDSAKVYRASSNIADDGTITFSLAKSGRGWVSAGDDEARTWFYFKADGTITLGSSDVINAANTDLDTYLCVYDNTGNSFIIKNRLGGSKVITYEIIVGK